MAVDRRRAALGPGPDSAATDAAAHDAPRPEEAPLRSELFTAEQMAQHGRSLAAVHRLGGMRGPDRLLPRLAANERVLIEVCALLAAHAAPQRRVTPAGEWLLDNFYLIEEEIRTAKLHLPSGYSRELPRLADDPANGPSVGLPRVYDLALQAVAHGEGAIARETLVRFVAAYQTGEPLMIGELWAIPIMLRLALIENLRRIGARIAAALEQRELAERWADAMLDVAERDPKGLILVVADMARSDPPMSGPFVAELARRLQGRSAALALPLTWIEQRLAESGRSIAQLVQTEAQTQAAAQVSVSNSIGSLRLLGAMDWREFVETLSAVEQALREDPADVYARMDFATRDRYRHAVEEIAAHGTLAQPAVARAAVQMAAEHAAAVARGEADPRASHVGHYLIGAGRAALEQTARVHMPWLARVQRRAAQRPLALYGGAVIVLTVVLAAGIGAAAGLRLALGIVPLAVALVLLLAMSQLATALVNWVATLLATPHALPRMDYSWGIPTSARTLIVVPTMLGSKAGIDALVEAIEVRFLANRDEQLHYGLLTDFHDAKEATREDDAALLAHAVECIEALNRKHGVAASGATRADRFFLFHRPRRWNPREGVWMGHERKRGKLADLNALLRGQARVGPGERFSMIVGETEALTGVRYVITLDTDTQLPRDAAWQFIATMAHPLNRPRFGGPAEAPRVVDGYGLLQPRVGVALPGVGRSRYARLFGGEPGIDPYTRAVSDLYQDLFGEGSFIGKGIYDVDAFEHVLGGRLPENRILSHDLLEGCYARSGLLSDVQLFEDSPARYDADMSRRHRWIRGDWQLLAWLMPRVRAVPTPAVPLALGSPSRPVPLTAEPAEPPQPLDLPNPISTLSRWKILDNLRRSLTQAALTALLMLGWSVLDAPVLWTLAVLAIVFVPPLLALAMDLARKPEALRLRQHAGATLPNAARQLGQGLLALATLPHEAALSFDAIARTLSRLAITRRRLLEWKPSADLTPTAAPGSVGDLLGTVRRMWAGPVLAIAAAWWLGRHHMEALAAAAPVLLLWFGSPVAAWWLSRPLERRASALSEEQTDFLRRLARRTWAFFEVHVGEQDHHLPPDNMQEHPVARIAHRTSPTNMGFALLANLSAYDFGYLTLGELVQRTTAALATMETLVRFRGHFYNWYDTLTLEPLHPTYVSTVDSGNLAGHLLTLRAGLAALADAPAPLQQVLAGLADTLGLVQASSGNGHGPHAGRLQRFAAQLRDARMAPPRTMVELRPVLETLARSAEELRKAVVPVNAPLDAAPTELSRWVHALDAQCRAALAELEAVEGPFDPPAPLPGAPALRHAHSAALLQLAERAGALTEMDYGFLYDPARDLMSIGYNVEERRRDSGYYDLLASEARLASFIAIAQGHAPQESWFALGRLLTTVDGEPILLSWSGSMFEYLMPMLVMPSYDATLLDQTCRVAVDLHIAYGKQRGVPWGISESGYNTTDSALNYQYRAFGVPGLGLKRGLAEDLVVAPYASVMALMVAPKPACQNLQRLVKDGMGGTFGLYEAIDYTPSRLPPGLPEGQSGAIVRSFMAHHQGMSLLSLAWLLLGQPMQRRFEADTRLQATLLLLQERIPKVVAFHPHTADRGALRTFGATETPLRLITTPDTRAPEVQLLSNGRYHVMLTHTGAGYSRWKDMAVTRWREDTTRDHWGSFCYLRDAGPDVESTAASTPWSNTHQPTRVRTMGFEAIFTEGRAEFRRRDHGIDAYTEIVVSPEDDIELRRLRLTNLSRGHRVIEVTSYAEVVLAPPAADALHPAFSKLFVQTEHIAQPDALLCTRRPRSPEEPVPWMFHLMTVHDARAGAPSHETDRARFIGRGRSTAAPQALEWGPAIDDPAVTGAMPRLPPGALSGTTGSVLDPIVATRRFITLEPEQTAIVDMVTGMSDSRAGCLALLGKYADRRLADRVFDLAWTHSQVVLRQINASEADAQLYARLASSVVYGQPALRADAGTLLRNRRAQSGLWGYSISGDLPIVLLRVSDAANIELVRQMVQAHAYWRLKGLAVDLVIWNEERDIYRQRLQDQILGLIAAGVEAHVIDRPGGIFVRHDEQISGEDRVLLQSVARAILSDDAGTLAEQVLKKAVPERRTAAFVPRRTDERRVGAFVPTREAVRPERAVAAAETGTALQLFNGLGGFSSDGREYVVAPGAGRRPPAPWVNVIANPRFGTVVSEAGSSYTWCENAHGLRLTPWHNDPVGDTGGEVLYLRDEETGELWCPTSLPQPRGDAPGSTYRTRHGFGYSVFEHAERGVASELTVFVALDAAVKFSVLKLRNEGPRARRLSLTAYVEWVLGDLREKTAQHITTEIRADHGALYARNPYSNDFGDWIAFLDIDPAERAAGSVSCDRTEFIGRNGTLARPAALARTRLSGRCGAGLDPCGAIQTHFDLPPGQTREIVLRLGMGRSYDEADELVARHRGSEAARSTLAAVRAHWEQALGGLQVRTPDAALDLLANGWLTYQTLACRMWARSGYYQSGGAFGFRDQLQDAMALVHTQPALLREHLVRCAGRQFGEGDVQHWWHPPAGRGVRTQISDDYLWLPLALARYVRVSGDAGVLEEQTSFLEGRPVQPGEDAYYDLPGRSPAQTSVYEHAVRALRYGLRFGEHGLPLMGAGDWNDGMNLVGHGGRGESVWLGFFLAEVLREFAPLARAHGDAELAAQCESERAGLATRLEAEAWDGGWYRRAYFDDGTPLGSATGEECQIDSIAQSWSVLSGVAPASRARQAMDALSARLVRPGQRLVQLLDPPFDPSRPGHRPNPGYISGYVPGVRENGGQYTHGAIWAAMAFAALGDHERTWALLAMINPLNHARTPADAARYKVEPYVMAADVYSVAPHTGRGGWSWYTGSAGWMLRLVTESLLGLRVTTTAAGATLQIAPCLPPDWPGFTLDYRWRDTPYRIEVVQAPGAASLQLDGALQSTLGIALQDDGRAHHALLRLPPAAV